MVNQNNIIHVTCFTNLDDYERDRWPIYLWNPRVGDHVESDRKRSLKIVAITHLYNLSNNIGDIKLKIELHN